MMYRCGPRFMCNRRLRAAAEFETGLGTHPISPSPDLAEIRGLIEPATTLPTPSSLDLRGSSQATAWVAVASTLTHLSHLAAYATACLPLGGEHSSRLRAWPGRPHPEV